MRKMTFQPVEIAVQGGLEAGRLVFADAKLVAVITHLDRSVSEELRSQWFLEAGFGPCETATPQLFASLEAAEQWVRERVEGAAVTAGKIRLDDEDHEPGRACDERQNDQGLGPAKPHLSHGMPPWLRVTVE